MRSRLRPSDGAGGARGLAGRLAAYAKAAGRVAAGDPGGADSVRRWLAKSLEPGGLDIEEIAGLLNATRSSEGREAALAFSAAYRRPHDRDLLLLPPLYFSSRCENACLYCDFRADGGRLTAEEFEREVAALIGLGYRSIELVSSQDPQLYVSAGPRSAGSQSFEIEAALDYFRRARLLLDQAGGGMLTSNIPPLDGPSLTRLREIGLDCFLLWVEAFDPAQYARLHLPSGPKSDQAFRLEAFDRALEAGIPHVAGAFLKGLADWRREEALLYALDRELRERHGRGFSIVGTPRLKGPFAAHPFVAAHAVSDEDYELNIALDRVLFDAPLWLQTRERPELNRRLIGTYGGGVVLTVDCSTAPGGYSAPPRSRAQFPVHRQDLGVSVRALEASGFRAIFDWNARTLREFQRRR